MSFLLLASAPALHANGELGFGGRLVNADGSPVKGPVTLEISFYDQETGGNLLGSGPLEFANVPLVDGVFHVDLEFAPADLDEIFTGRKGPTYVQVRDLTNDKTYPRQKYLAVPYALKVPTDGKTIGFDASGQLTVKSTPEAGDSLVTTLNAATTETLSSAILPSAGGDLSGTLDNATVTKIQGNAVAAEALDASNNGMVLTWTASGWKAMPPSGGGGIANTDALPEGGSNLYFTDQRAKDAAVEDAITDGKTDVAPSQNAVHDALAQKEDALPSGTAAQYLKGNKTLGTFADDVKAAAVEDAITDGKTDVAPSQNAVHDALAQKEDALPSGTAAQYLKGNKTLGTFADDVRAAVVEDAIADGKTDVAPSQNAVHDALALKGDVFAGGQDGALTLGTNDANDLTLKTADTPRVTIKSDGKVGIGTETPEAALHVADPSGIRAHQICDESGSNCKDISAGWETLSASEPIYYTCSNADSLDSSNTPCYSAAQNNGNGTAEYRIHSCQAFGYPRTGIMLRWNGSAWQNHSGTTGDWYDCDDGTAVVMKLTATGGSYTSQWSDATGGIAYTSGNVGIGTADPDDAAVLELSSTTQGLLPPRMTTAQRLAIASPPIGLQVWDTDGHVLPVSTGRGGSSLGRHRSVRSRLGTKTCWERLRSPGDGRSAMARPYRTRSRRMTA